MKQILIVFSVVIFFTSCMSKKKYMGLKTSYDNEVARSQDLRQDLMQCQEYTANLRDKIENKDDVIANKNSKITSLNEEIGYLKKNNNNLLERLEDMAVINKEGAASITESLSAIKQQNKHIWELNDEIRRRDSMNMLLANNLKKSLDDINDDDIDIEIKEGVVYVSLSDKLLFQSGSDEINKRAENVLGKVAKIAKDNNNINLLVEGHTDNVPISTTCAQDNWDLSVMRATAVVRLLHEKHNVAPERLMAAGKGQYSPKVSNTTKEGKATNRRTEILIVPKMDQFVELFVTD